MPHIGLLPLRQAYSPVCAYLSYGHQFSVVIGQDEWHNGNVDAQGLLGLLYIFACLTCISCNWDGEFSGYWGKHCIGAKEYILCLLLFRRSLRSIKGEMERNNQVLCRWSRLFCFIGCCISRGKLSRQIREDYTVRMVRHESCSGCVLCRGAV